MNKPHKHAELIKAWADGATIEAKQLGEDIWIDVTKHPCWHDCMEYRIKPKTIKYRNFLWTPLYSYAPDKATICVCSQTEQQQEPRDKWIGFIKWINDWQEVEV